MTHWDISATTQDGRSVTGIIVTGGHVMATEEDEAFYVADTAAIVEVGSRLDRSSFVLNQAAEQRPRGEQRVWVVADG